MFLMNIINHLLTIGEVFSKEIHCIPQVVASPVLPVLDDTIKRHVERTILVNNTLLRVEFQVFHHITEKKT